MRTVISAGNVDTFLDYLFQTAVLVEAPLRLRPALRDPDDDRILEVAARMRATIITYNGRDFAGAGLYGVPVLEPIEFLLRIGELP